MGKEGEEARQSRIKDITNTIPYRAVFNRRETWEHKQGDLWQPDKVCAAEACTCSRETAVLPGLVMQIGSRTLVQSVLIWKGLFLFSKPAFTRRSV